MEGPAGPRGSLDLNNNNQTHPHRAQNIAASSSWSSSSQGISSFFLVYLTMLTVALVSCRLLEGLKETKEAAGFLNKLKRAVGKYVTEAGVIILVGIAFGGPIAYAGERDRELDPTASSGNSTSNSTSTEELPGDLATSLLSFSPTTFFLLLLPPIIFNSGYHMNRQLFFPLLPAILGYAVLGTIISTFIVGVGLSALGKVSGFNPSLAEVRTIETIESTTYYSRITTPNHPRLWHLEPSLAPLTRCQPWPCSRPRGWTRFCSTWSLEKAS